MDIGAGAGDWAAAVTDTGCITDGVVAIAAALSIDSDERDESVDSGAASADRICCVAVDGTGSVAIDMSDESGGGVRCVDRVDINVCGCATNDDSD